jgi:Fe-S cluster assembly protein SufD
MTVAATKTKAEQALSQSFEAVAARLPGGRAVAEARKAAIGAFAALGLPHRRIEEWKYTDLRVALKEALPPAVEAASKVTAAEIDGALETLAALDAWRVVFVDGMYAPDLSSVAGAEGLEVTPLAAVLAKSADRAGDGLIREGAPSQEAVIALNTAFMTDGAVVRVAEGAQLAKPLLLVFARAGKQGRLVTTRNIIGLAGGARATIIEAHVALAGTAPGQANTLSEISLGDGAHLAHLEVALAGDAATQLATWLATLGAGATYRAFQLTAATGLARSNLFVTFKGEDARLDISGLFLGRETQHIDTTLVVDHAVPGCESRELIKGVLADRARGVFQGKVIVRPDAQKSDGKQMAQVLMLSPDAEFDSKPELEIYADDVVCGHGSTAAELDEDLLFYMRARGMPLEKARALLIESFIGEAIDKVEDEAVREAFSSLAKGRLGELSAGQSASGGGRT